MIFTLLKNAVALVSCGLLAFGAAQVQADEQKLPSGTPYDQIGQKIENYYQKHEKTASLLPLLGRSGNTWLVGLFCLPCCYFSSLSKAS